MKDSIQYSKQLIPDWAKIPARRLLWRYRLATHRSRSLPGLIIIGSQRSGTTSLYHYLSQHPHLKPSYKKEVHFFDGGLNPRVDNYRMGLEWYRAHFPLKASLGKHFQAFEASPMYIFNPNAPRRISELVPAVRLVAVLRNPTERAISHFFHEKRLGREPLSINEALRVEERRLERALRLADYKSDAFIHHSYIHRGLYKEQVERYQQYFSAEQMLILSSEEFFGETTATLRKLFLFIGVDPGIRVRDLKPRNVATNRNKVDPAVYEYLNSTFAPHNRALYELLDKDFGWQ